MPTIRNYQTQESAQGSIGGRAARASDFYVASGIGAGVDDFAQGLIVAEERKETSDMQVFRAKSRAKWTVEMDRRARAGAFDDPDAVDKFADELDADLAKAGENITTAAGRRAYEQARADLASHFVQKASLFSAAAAGEKAKQSYLEALNDNRTALVADPSQLDAVMGEMQSSLDDPASVYAALTPGQRRELAETTRQELAKSAVQGMIRVNPQGALKLLQEGRYSDDLGADALVQLEGSANTAIRAQQAEDDRRKKAAKEAREEQRDEIKRDFNEKLYKNELTAREVLDADVLDPKDQEHYVKLIETRAKDDGKAPASSGPVAVALFDRIHLPDDHPSKIRTLEEIDQAYIDRKISREDLNSLRTEFNDLRTPDGQRLGETKTEFFKALRPQIDKSNPLMGRIDQTGKQNAYQYQVYVNGLVQQYREQGKNPYDLFDPTKSDYVGKPETLRMFQKTIQASTRYVSEQLRRKPAANQRRPGETIQEYLKRTGKQ